MMRLNTIACLTAWLAFHISDGFVVGVAPPIRSSSHTILQASPSTQTDSLMKPTYEVEKIPIRIGHGFDIHRMAPIDEAGQPVVIGGVVIDHKPQKWTDAEGKYVEKGGIYETELGVVAHSDGDVVYHSIVDAIFGALTLPDIGQVFVDTDPRWSLWNMRPKS